jgi:hypothetical protein
MVQHLKTDRLLRPFDLLCTSMNFWRAFSQPLPAASRFAARSLSSDGPRSPQPVPPPSGRWRAAISTQPPDLPRRPPVQTDADKSIADLRSDWDALVGRSRSSRIRTTS